MPNHGMAPPQQQLQGDQQSERERQRNMDGVSEAVNGTKLVDGVPVAGVVAKGEAEIGINVQMAHLGGRPEGFSLTAASTAAGWCTSGLAA